MKDPVAWAQHNQPLILSVGSVWPLELGRVLLLPLIPENNLKDQVKLEIRVSRMVNGSLDGSTKEMIGLEIRVSRMVNGSLDGSTKEMIGWEI
ncbi:hypothetical protein DY000_02007731 [Brassica cretica]|uniref:Uncharacterized protein n=1 Tax=Brassica cretica TaxID=69181 RepID=A0ABQ7C4K9_BRACR|nr:hypothetical protein DY000_02007731 [Brassica cretica]